jgi:hypothetical protein
MTPEEESSKSQGSGAPAKRPRRSHRGGRGRRRKPVQPASEAGAKIEPVRARTDAAETFEAAESAVEPLLEEAPSPDSAIEEARREAAEASLSEQRDEPEYREERSVPAHPDRRDFKPATPVAISDAITLVTHILTSLKRVLDEMEEVLETLELAEVQKNADEGEIQSLLHALRQFERRGPEPRHEQQGGSYNPRPQDRGPRRQGRR